MEENTPEMDNTQPEESSGVSNIDPRIVQTKTLRRELDKSLTYLKDVSKPMAQTDDDQPLTRASRERSLAVTGGH